MEGRKGGGRYWEREDGSCLRRWNLREKGIVRGNAGMLMLRKRSKWVEERSKKAGEAVGDNDENEDEDEEDDDEIRRKKKTEREKRSWKKGVPSISDFDSQLFKSPRRPLLLRRASPLPISLA